MVRQFPPFSSQQKKKDDYLWRWCIVSERTFRKITVPLNFQPKFPDLTISERSFRKIPVPFDFQPKFPDLLAK